MHNKNIININGQKIMNIKWDGYLGKFEIEFRNYE